MPKNAIGASLMLVVFQGCHCATPSSHDAEKVLCLWPSQTDGGSDLEERWSIVEATRTWIHYPWPPIGRPERRIGGGFPDSPIFFRDRIGICRVRSDEHDGGDVQQNYDVVWIERNTGKVTSEWSVLADKFFAYPGTPNSFSHPRVVYCQTGNSFVFVDKTTSKVTEVSIDGMQIGEGPIQLPFSVSSSVFCQCVGEKCYVISRADYYALLRNGVFPATMDDWPGGFHQKWHAQYEDGLVFVTSDASTAVIDSASANARLFFFDPESGFSQEYAITGGYGLSQKPDEFPQDGLVAQGDNGIVVALSARGERQNSGITTLPVLLLVDLGDGKTMTSRKSTCVPSSQSLLRNDIGLALAAIYGKNDAREAKIWFYDFNLRYIGERSVVRVPPKIAVGGDEYPSQIAFNIYPDGDGWIVYYIVEAGLAVNAEYPRENHYRPDDEIYGIGVVRYQITDNLEDGGNSSTDGDRDGGTGIDINRDVGIHQ